jgi:hypothetical protein
MRNYENSKPLNDDELEARLYLWNLPGNSVEAQERIWFRVAPEALREMWFVKKERMIRAATKAREGIGIMLDQAKEDEARLRSDAPSSPETAIAIGYRAGLQAAMNLISTADPRTWVHVPLPTEIKIKGEKVKIGESAHE